MLKNIALSLLAVVLFTNSNFPPNAPILISPALGDYSTFGSAHLQVAASDADGDALDVSFYGRPTSNHAPNFTIAVLPDTQNYSESYPKYFDAQTSWIHNHQVDRNIQAVFHLGDVVNSNSSLTQWQNAAAAMSILGTDLPFGLAIGNHDQTPSGSPRGSTLNFNTYFGINIFAGRSYYGGHFGSNNDNSYILFSTSNLDFIVIFLEYDPFEILTPALRWADDLLQQYSNRLGIVVAHSILDTSGNWTSQGVALESALKDNPNLILMLSGHMHGARMRTDTFVSHIFTTILTDFQDLPNGGNGYLRLLEFKPALNQIEANVYSPVLDQNETHYSASHFLLNQNLTPTFRLLGSQHLAPTDSNASLYWPGMKFDRNYEWYVTVSDGQSTVTSPVWFFRPIVKGIELHFPTVELSNTR